MGLVLTIRTNNDKIWLNLGYLVGHHFHSEIAPGEPGNFALEKLLRQSVAELGSMK
jgi:hypothetical protein